VGVPNLAGAWEKRARSLRWRLLPLVPPQVIAQSAPLKAAASDRVGRITWTATATATRPSSIRVMLLERIPSPMTLSGDLGKRRSAQR
jgi:hypothetical protein